MPNLTLMLMLLVYLPLDTGRNAERLIQLIDPSLIVFSKFDIWPNLVWKASKHNIPIIVVAGTLHAASKRLSRFAKPFFSECASTHLRALCDFGSGCGALSRALLSVHIRLLLQGDTRYEQVYRPGNRY